MTVLCIIPGPSPLVMPSYYDPTWRLRCPNGHADTEFPRGLW